jgi:TetR/AcrR family transcriptional regulator, regulator of cefoperazone and chloramphenicol sensitivity
MTRPSDITRDRIMKAAERLFAERGYDGTSIRAIVAKARVNQAAINYHFVGKDGLYSEVLRGAFCALTEHQFAHAEDTKAMSREQALDEFVRGQLRPLIAADELSRHIRIFNWETVRPTAVFRKLVREEATPFVGLAVRSRPPLSAQGDGSAHVHGCGHLADRPMQRVRAQPRATRRSAGWLSAR